MPISYTDLVEPRGRINAAALFPGEPGTTLAARLAEYIKEGGAKFDALEPPPNADRRDAAVAAWAYFRAYSSAYDRMLATPSTVSLNDQGSASTLVTQITTMGDRAREFRAEFDSLVAVERAPDPSFPRTAPTSIDFTF